MSTTTVTPPAAAPAARPPLLERLGTAFLRKASSRATEPPGGAHVLSGDERKTLQRIQAAAIRRAALAGALSGLATAVAEVLTAGLVDARAWSDRLLHYLIVYGVTAIATAIEIGFLYWDALRTVQWLAHNAGMDLTAEVGDEETMRRVLARAALELPDPNEPVLGVDPQRNASKAKIVMLTLLYKIKIAMTGFILKLLIRRYAGRAAARVWLPFIAVPVTAVWNAIICWLVLREARMRVMGPSLAKEVADTIVREREPVPPELAVGAMRAVASAAVQSSTIHPNVASLLAALHERLGSPLGDPAELPAGEPPLDDVDTFLTLLSEAEPADQQWLVGCLDAGMVVDGHLSSSERRFLVKARAACSHPPSYLQPDNLRKDFVTGVPFQPGSRGAARHWPAGSPAAR